MLFFELPSHASCYKASGFSSSIVVLCGFPLVHLLPLLSVSCPFSLLLFGTNICIQCLLMTFQKYHRVSVFFFLFFQLYNFIIAHEFIVFLLDQLCPFAATLCENCQFTLFLRSRIYLVPLKKKQPQNSSFAVSFCPCIISQILFICLSVLSYSSLNLQWLIFLVRQFVHLPHFGVSSTDLFCFVGTLFPWFSVFLESWVNVVFCIWRSRHLLLC